MQAVRLINVGCTNKEKKKKRKKKPQRRASESYIIHYFISDIYNNEKIQRCNHLSSTHDKLQKVTL